MDVFDLRRTLVQDYEQFTRSFVNVRDGRIAQRVDQEFAQGLLWPEPLVQLNPTFEPGETVEDLVTQGALHPDCARIFRRKTNSEDFGTALRLHRHQADAVRLAAQGSNYVMTTGTGSGKSLGYIIPIVDRVLRDGAGKGIRAIVVYPMNALANSQEKELEKFINWGYPGGQGPVTFRRYTGQEKDAERQAIMAAPPDILLTNYAMLELVLTRPEESRLVESANLLRFLVLDEFHTYRGRQGADVALLARRLCQWPTRSPRFWPSKSPHPWPVEVPACSARRWAVRQFRRVS